MEPFIPPPPSCTACLDHDAGRMTRKLIGRPCELVSVGAIAPSIEQYAGALPAAATHLGEASDTPATGSPIDPTGISVPSFALVQSSAEIVRAAGAAGV